MDTLSTVFVRLVQYRVLHSGSSKWKMSSLALQTCELETNADYEIQMHPTGTLAAALCCWTGGFSNGSFRVPLSYAKFSVNESEGRAELKSFK